MRQAIKKAVCGQGKTAAKNKLRNGVYLKAAPLSSLKTYIGDLLFSLDGTNRPDGWKRFEKTLREYINLKRDIVC
jgi:hypothetical protein